MTHRAASLTIHNMNIVNDDEETRDRGYDVMFFFLFKPTYLSCTE